MSSTVLNFKRELEISLEMLLWERVSSGDDGGTSWFFSSCEGELGISLESLQGK